MLQGTSLLKKIAYAAPVRAHLLDVNEPERLSRRVTVSV